MKKDDFPVAVPVSVPIALAANAPPMPAPHSAGIYPSYKYLNGLNQNQIKELKMQGYTQGLIDIISQTTNYFPLRIWVVDNSGSMNKNDGNRLVSTKNSSIVKLVQCTRWNEIQETVNYHAQMAALVQAPVTFRLLNNPGAHIGPQEFSIADKGMDPNLIEQDLQLAKRVMMKSSPSGVTPLAQHVRDISQLVATMADDLNSQGKKIVVVLATDGLPTNDRGVGGSQERNDFTDSLKAMEGLPVWIVIRLCTDEDDVVEFYNNLDAQLELSIEVLDDFTGEAEEVYEQNPWLNYSLPLHRMREMGISHRLFDLLDERPFTKSELREFCYLLFGQGAFDGVPEPELDFNGFLTALRGIVRDEKEQWNPIKKKMKPILNLEKMHQVYGDSSCVVM